MIQCKWPWFGPSVKNLSINTLIVRGRNLQTNDLFFTLPTATNDLTQLERAIWQIQENVLRLRVLVCISGNIGNLNNEKAKQ